MAVHEEEGGRHATLGFGGSSHRCPEGGAASLQRRDRHRQHAGRETPAHVQTDVGRNQAEDRKGVSRNLLFTLLALSSLGWSCAQKQGYVPEAPPKAEEIVFDPNQGKSLMPLTKGSQWMYHVTFETYSGDKLEGSQEQD